MKALVYPQWDAQEREEGGEQRAPMGQAVIGGVIASGLPTLVVVPVIYTHLDDIAAWARGWGKLRGSRAATPTP